MLTTTVISWPMAETGVALERLSAPLTTVRLPEAAEVVDPLCTVHVAGKLVG
jgi:hypothetical protein